MDFVQKLALCLHCVELAFDVQVGRKLAHLSQVPHLARREKQAMLMLNDIFLHQSSKESVNLFLL